MDTIRADEAANRFDELLDRVEQGESFLIEREGIRDAILQPASSLNAQSRANVIAQIIDFQARHSLNGLSIRELIESDRK